MRWEKEVCNVRNRVYGEIETYYRQSEKAKKQTDRNEKKIFDQGAEWFKSGLPLEEAPSNIKDNINFINGFNRASRVAAVEEELYQLGVNFFKSGKDIDEAPLNYKNKEMFIKGYNDTMNNERKR